MAATMASFLTLKHSNICEMQHHLDWVCTDQNYAGGSQAPNDFGFVTILLLIVGQQ